MSERLAELETALDQLVTAARAHLTAVAAAAGAPDDEAVWQAFVTLNNAAQHYDELLNDVFDEVTPWDLEPIVEGADGARATVVSLPSSPAGDDPHPRVVSVRQRRDYRVPSVSALLRVADVARRNSVPDDEDAGAVENVGEAVLELLQAGDGSLSSLDVPELEPLDGLLTVTEIGEPLDLEEFEDSDGSGPFAPKDGDLLVGRLDEHPFLPDEEEDHAGHNH